MLVASLLFVPVRAEQQPGAASTGGPVAILVPDLVAGDPADSDLGREIARLVAAELQGSGAFAPRADDDGPGKAQARIEGRIDRLPDHRRRIRVRLFDAIAGWHLLGREYTITPEQWRDVAHELADAIHEQLIGRPVRVPGARN
jgi:TolB protein